MKTDITDPAVNPKRLPLWKSALEDLRAKGIAYGQTIPLPELEEALCSRDHEREFNLAISKIRRELEKDGFYLSGRGKKASGVFTVIPARSNLGIAKNRQHQASDELARAVVLLTNTLTDGWTVEEKRKLTSSLERLQTKRALETKAVKILEVLKTHSPKLLE